MKIVTNSEMRRLEQMAGELGLPAPALMEMPAEPSSTLWLTDGRWPDCVRSYSADRAITVAMALWRRGTSRNMAPKSPCSR